MKNKTFMMGVAVILLIGCTSPKYLPGSDQIDTNYYGSYITIVAHNGEITSGELLAVDNSFLYILKETDRKNKSQVIKISLNVVGQFKLKYAKSVNYGWTIPLYTLATLSHGYYSAFTAPVNLITTTGISINSNRDFMYDNTTLHIQDLRMFARYPQGLPPNIELSVIRN